MTGTTPSPAAPDGSPADEWSLFSPRTTRAVLLMAVGVYAAMGVTWLRRGVGGASMMWSFAALMAVFAARRPTGLGRGRELALVLLTFGVALAGLTAPHWLAGW